MQSEREACISKLEDRIGTLGAKIETTMHEDQLLLLHVDHVVAHCRRSLEWMDESSKAHEEKETRDPDSTSIEEPPSFCSSATDTTGCEMSMQPSASIAAVMSQGSTSAIEARELFPGTPTSVSPQTAPSPESSRTSPRTHFVRKITYAREQQVRAIMLNMRKRMQRRGSA